MEEKRTTESLDSVLKKTHPDDFRDYCAENAEQLITADKAFAGYMRALLKKKGVRQQDLFLAADIPEGYGYKLISEEKHTRQRDVILRMCFAGHFSLTETQRALKLYGFSELYSRIPRDAVMIIAINSSIYDIEKIENLLSENNMEQLYSCHSEEN